MLQGKIKYLRSRKNEKKDLNSFEMLKFLRMLLKLCFRGISDKSYFFFIASTTILKASILVTALSG